jgi:hypothetical protein
MFIGLLIVFSPLIIGLAMVLAGRHPFFLIFMIAAMAFPVIGLSKHGIGQDAETVLAGSKTTTIAPLDHGSTAAVSQANPAIDTGSKVTRLEKVRVEDEFPGKAAIQNESRGKPIKPVPRRETSDDF